MYPTPGHLAAPVRAANPYYKGLGIKAKKRKGGVRVRALRAKRRKDHSIVASYSPLLIYS